MTINKLEWCVIGFLLGNLWGWIWSTLIHELNQVYDDDKRYKKVTTLLTEEEYRKQEEKK